MFQFYFLNPLFSGLTRFLVTSSALAWTYCLLIERITTEPINITPPNTMQRMRVAVKYCSLGEMEIVYYELNSSSVKPSVDPSGKGVLSAMIIIGVLGSESRLLNDIEFVNPSMFISITSFILQFKQHSLRKRERS